MTVRGRLTTAFGLLATMVMLVSGSSLWALSDANKRFVDYVDGINARASG